MPYTGYTAPQVQLKTCHICSAELLPNPLYDETVSKYCPHHGDFFVIRLRDKAPSVVFRAFEIQPENEPKRVRPSRAKTPTERSVHIPKAKRVRPSRDKAPTERSTYVPMPKPENRPGNPGINVRCDQTGIIFATIREAAIVMRLDPTSIVRVLRGKQRAASGYTFTKMDGTQDDHFVPKPRLPLLHVNSGGEKQAIRCDQTGVIFESVAEASRQMGLRKVNISKQINGHQTVVQGYTFTKIERASHASPPDGSVSPSP